MKKLFHNRKTLYFILGFVMISVFTLTIAYAALNTVLKITGNAEVVASNWDIHLDNINVKSGSVGGVAPTITSSTTASFSTKLTTPGDFYEFSIDVVNDGSIDAMIDSVTKIPTLTESQSKYLNYIVEYENGNTISTRQLVEAGSFVRLKVRVEYRNDLTSSDLPTINDSLTLSFTVNYVQADNSGTNVLNNGTLKAMVKSGIGTDVGDEICIGNECFYVISSTDNDVTMLAKYNLLVGNTYDGASIVPIENATGIQGETSKGWFYEYSIDNPITGTESFAENRYWENSVSSYPSFVYNDNSNLYQYVENYEGYLESLGISINEARLIKLEELESLGCVRSSNSCSGAPNWVYSTTYWTGTANNFQNIWRVVSTEEISPHHYDYRNFSGVRPVITVSKNQILGIKSKIKPVSNGSLDDIGTVVTIGSEQFYTIGTEGDNVKLLAKYNLYVGNKVDDQYGTMPLKTSTGIQDKSAKGWFNSYSVENPIIGTKPFANTNYWSSVVSEYPAYVYNVNSLLYEYVENYKKYLEDLGIVIEEARLTKLDELVSLGCDALKQACWNNAPSWVYSTTYWTGEANSSDFIWFVNTGGSLSGEFSYTNTLIGTRPVIVIPKSEF